MSRQTGEVPAVLVVEDDVIVRLVIADDLRQAGFKVIEAGTGTEAQSILSSGERVDVLFTDIHMPGRLNGIALAEHVLATFPQTRIILTSGSEDGHEVAGASRIPYLRKPCRPETVIAEVKRAAGERAADRGTVEARAER